jgi:hypothetical protein
MTILNWKKGFFSQTYNIYSSNLVIGMLKNKTWSSSAEGEINGRKYLFKTQGFFKQSTQIIDIENGAVVGNITYNSWMTKAMIENLGIIAFWKYDNFWNTKWSIVGQDGTEIYYEGSSTKGQIIFEKQNDLLALTGLFVTNYYWQMTIVILIAVFIPIWTSAMSR